MVSDRFKKYAEEHVAVWFVIDGQPILYSPGMKIHAEQDTIIWLIGYEVEAAALPLSITGLQLVEGVETHALLPDVRAERYIEERRLAIYHEISMYQSSPSGVLMHGPEICVKNLILSKRAE